MPSPPQLRTEGRPCTAGESECRSRFERSQIESGHGRGAMVRMARARAMNQAPSKVRAAFTCLGRRGCSRRRRCRLGRGCVGRNRYSLLRWAFAHSTAKRRALRSASEWRTGADRAAVTRLDERGRCSLMKETGCQEMTLCPRDHALVQKNRERAQRSGGGAQCVFWTWGGTPSGLGTPCARPIACNIHTI